MTDLRAALAALVEFASNIRCYPEGPVGFEELAEAIDTARAALASPDPPVHGGTLAEALATTAVDVEVLAATLINEADLEGGRTFDVAEALVRARRLAAIYAGLAFSKRRQTFPDWDGPELTDEQVVAEVRALRREKRAATMAREQPLAPEGEPDD